MAPPCDGGSGRHSNMLMLQTSEVEKRKGIGAIEVPMWISIVFLKVPMETVQR